MQRTIDMAFDRLPKDERYRGYMARFRENNPQGYGSLALGMVGTDNTKILSELTVPVLVTVGENDILLPSELSRKVHGLLRNSEFEMIPNAAAFCALSGTGKIRTACQRLYRPPGGATFIAHIAHIALHGLGDARQSYFLLHYR